MEEDLIGLTAQVHARMERGPTLIRTSQEDGTRKAL